MIEPILRRLIEHKRRKTIILVVAILTGLLVVLPAADEYNAARARLSAARLDVEEMQSAFDDLPRFEQLFKSKTQELQQLENRAVSEANAQGLRGNLVEMVRQTGCTMRQIRFGEPIRRDWTTADDPVRGGSAAERGEKTPYQLEARQISLSVTGSMANLHEFMAQIHRLDQFIHTKSVALKRAEDGGNAAIMDMDVLLFDLVKKPPS